VPGARRAPFKDGGEAARRFGAENATNLKYSDLARAFALR